ncbi:SDR family NAD(P)-dependent oxidoreductase [soil metagenome]
MSEPAVAIVTGACRGMGLAIAAQLARDGFRVYGIDVLQETLDTAFAGLKADGLDVIALPLDLRDEAAVNALPQRLGADYGRLEVLVNNAAVSPKSNGRKTAFVDLSLADWDAVMGVNLTGTFLMSRICLPPMIARKFGRIINNSSVGGKTVIGVAVASYNASKAGMLGLTRALAMEVAPMGVTVNAICPGRIETAMTSEAVPETNANLLKRTPVGRFGTTQEIADLASFLASRRSSFITGAAMDINGGLAMV